MKFVIVGLGNPGGEYEGTRHNAGRDIVEMFVKKADLGEWEAVPKKKPIAQVAKGKLGKHEVLCVLPDLFMNNSGKVVAQFVKSKSAAKNLIVIQDDLDMPLGSQKLMFNRGSGGHRGIESISRALKTKEFIRLKIGVSPHTAGGKLKKPQGEKEVIAFILGHWKPKEEDALKKIEKNAKDALELVMDEGLDVAMNQVNTR
jgi:peptidyl-tRNA hydrolase, PTH1 family